MRVVYRDPDLGYLDSCLWVPKKHIPLEATKAALQFNTMDSRTMRFLTLWQETEHHLLIPREFWDPSSFSFEVVDCRPTEYPSTQVTSKITLDFKNPGETTQRDAVQSMREARGGILQLACGKGKTVCALELIAQEKVPAMIVVDNTHLMEQWEKAIEQFLHIPGGLGFIRGDRFDWDKDVVLTTYQTLSARAAEFPEHARRRFGLLIWDEAHHMAAPTWLVSADLFPGKRIGLTATPERADGMHVVYDFHLGKVLYKDLTQELKPQIFFLWTGLEVDTSDPLIKEKTCDVNGELHTGLLAGYFGQWRQRVDFILKEVRDAAAQGRKILVLSYSVAELVNMLAVWNNETSLYSDIPTPTPADVGETLDPQYLDDRTIRKLQRKRGELFDVLNHRVPLKHPLTAQDIKGIQMHVDEINNRLKQHEVAEKIQKELEKRQARYVKDLLANHGGKSTAGLMIGDIKPKERARMLREKQVTFAIMKYGREGLDEQSLDTVFVCEPMSQKNALQQLMGRVLRFVAGKKQPIVVFFEDNIGPIIGMCQNLRRHLNQWPLEEGGPFTYTLVGHPRKGRGTRTWGMKI